MKDGAINHPKMKRLARLLKIPLPYANGIMERLWHATEDYHSDGAIGTSDNAQIAEYCALDVLWDPDEFIAALVTTGFLDQMPLPGRLFVHDWPDHCTDYIHRRIARKHGYFANGEPPKLAWFSKDLRQPFEEFYEAHPTGPQNAEMGPHRGPQLSLMGPQNAEMGPLARARPTPTPTPTPSTTEVSSINQNRIAREQAESNGNPTWKSDPAFARFVTDYLQIAQHFIDEDFADAFTHVWEKLPLPQRMERVQALLKHSSEYTEEPRFVPKPRKFLETEWKRPLKPEKTRRVKESATSKAKRIYEQKHAKRI